MWIQIFRFILNYSKVYLIFVMILTMFCHSIETLIFRNINIYYQYFPIITIQEKNQGNFFRLYLGI